MHHTYTIETNGRTITMILYRGHRFIATIQGNPLNAINSLNATASLWRSQYQATGKSLGSPAMWEALGPLYTQARDELLNPVGALV